MMFAAARNNTCSALGLACRAGDATAVRSLLEAGRCVDVRDNRGWTPIHEAAAGNHEECVKLLIEHGESDLNWTTFEGLTPLSLASKKGFLNIVRLLLRHQADPNICDTFELSPLIYVVSGIEKASMIIECLVKAGAKVNHQEIAGETALHEFVRKGNDTSVLQLLLDNGAEVDIRDDCGMTPVFFAAQWSNKIFLELLLQHARKVGKESVINLGAEDGTTPLMIAAQNKSLEIVELLLEKGADPNRTTIDNVTALHLAVQVGSLECVKVLAEKTNLDVLVYCSLNPLSRVELPSSVTTSRPIKEGRSLSPLHIAVRWKRYQILSFLLASSFNPNAFLQSFGRDDNVFIDLHSSHNCGMRRAELTSALGEAVLLNDLESAKMLLEAGCNVNPERPDVIAPLTIAAYYGHTELTKLLLDHGANPNHPNEPGLPKMCSLPLIAASNDIKSLRLILKAGGDGRLCLPGRGCGCPDALALCHPLFLSGHDVMEVISIYQEFHGDKLKSSYLSTLHDAVFPTDEDFPTGGAFEQQRWKRVVEVSEKPQSLASLCRMKVRECVMDDLSVPGTFDATLKSMGLPDCILEYLQFESAY